MTRRKLMFVASLVALAAATPAKNAEAATMCADYGQTCDPFVGEQACCNIMLICQEWTNIPVPQFRCEAKD
jgi:hypothetical protein